VVDSVLPVWLCNQLIENMKLILPEKPQLSQLRLFHPRVFLISDAADLLPKMKAEVRLSAPSFERLLEPAKAIVHDPHNPTIPVIAENTVDSVPIPAALYDEKDIRSDAPVIGVSNG